MDSLEHKPEISVVVIVYWNMDISILVLTSRRQEGVVETWLHTGRLCIIPNSDKSF